VFKSVFIQKNSWDFSKIPEGYRKDKKDKSKGITGF
jgi:hypothetical protein